MSDCPTCGNHSWLCQQCKMDALEDRHGTPANQDRDLWVLEDGLWHASVAFDGETHTCNCGETAAIPVTRTCADLRHIPEKYDAPVCRKCATTLEGPRQETVPEDASFERASELRADGGIVTEGELVDRAVREAADLVEAGDSRVVAVDYVVDEHELEHRRDDVRERVEERLEQEVATDGGRGQASSGAEHYGDYAIVGECVGCGGQMVETVAVNTENERCATLTCQDCDAEAELRHDFEDGLEGGSWSGVGDPEFKAVSWIDCPRCHGYGEIEDPICDLRRAMNGREHPCPNCDATGSIPRIVETDGGRDPEELVVVTCDPCDYQSVVAAGTLPMTSCPDCQGDLEIDDDHVAHKCPDATGFNHVTVEKGERCPFCQTVQGQPVATDGGVDEDDEYYVVDEDRAAVVAGQFNSKEDAAEEARDRGPGHIVATEGSLELIALTSNTTIRWENDDGDIVTDGGVDIDPDAIREETSFLVRRANSRGAKAALHLPAEDATREDPAAQCRYGNRDGVAFRPQDIDATPDWQLIKRGCSECFGTATRAPDDQYGRGPADVLEEAGFDVEDEDSEVATDGGVDQSLSEKEKFEYGVLIRAWGTDDEPGEARHREYVVEATDEDEAEEKAIEKAKNHFTKGIIGRKDGYDVLEVERYSHTDTELVTDGGRDLEGRQAFLAGDAHWCDICSTPFDRIDELSNHDCQPIRADGGSVSWTGPGEKHASDGMQCHECETTHDDWTKDGKHAVDDGHHSGIIERWKCGICGAITEGGRR